MISTDRGPVLKILLGSVKYITVGAIVTFFCFPIFWTVITSIKPLDLIPRMPPVWWFRPTLEHYISIFVDKGLTKSLWNSFSIATMSTVLSLLVGTPAAYAFSRFKLPAKEHLAFYFLTARMAPPISVILPLFLIFSSLGLLDTKFVLVIAYMTFNFSFVIWMMRGFFNEIPPELDESAMVDGCSRFGAFLKVALPLTAPGLAASAIICFIFSWNEFLFALILTNISAKTLPVAAAGFITDRMVLWGKLCAASVVIYLPVMIFGLLTRRYLIRGLTLGGIK
ncbi:MAG: carbohydrate ABC transporter permease [Deltaproteobacteria bacterium]|nr:carbohydrate ABC transporter permease [Deltaproteobacteria bacterium]MBW2121024.1 carbohydrate ABC transporter permease [Deltaproteobacteria bacterium]